MPDAGHFWTSVSSQLFPPILFEAEFSSPEKAEALIASAANDVQEENHRRTKPSEEKNPYWLLGFQPPHLQW